VQSPSFPSTTLVPILVVFALLLFRMARMRTPRPMRLGALWVRPGLFAVVAAVLVYTAPPHGVLQVLALAGALAIGGVLGWHQGKLMQITVDATSDALQVKASTWAAALFLAMILLRMGLRSWLTADSSPLHAYVAVATDGFLLFALGFYAARAAEMFIRGRALLQAARQSPAGAG
jgi:hypothetical protein